MNELGSIITIILAVYGALLSTVLAIHEFKKGRPTVRVSASFGTLYNGEGQPSEPLILIEAVNSGSGTVALTGVGWLKKDGSKQHILLPHPPGVLPRDLHERKQCIVTFACRWFKENIDHKNVVAVYFQDQTGKKWIGKIKAKQRDAWLAANDEGWKIA